MIGQTISHYRIVDKLGEGGMGVVYKAEDTRLKRTVALRFLSAQALGNEDEKARFLREAQAAALLDHPNIAAVHDIEDAHCKTATNSLHISFRGCTIVQARPKSDLPPPPPRLFRIGVPLDGPVRLHSKRA